MKNIKNCPTQSDVIDTIINNIDIRGINKNRFYVEICKLFNADTYINAIGGLNLYDSMNFQNNGIKLLFLNSFKIHYKQFSSNFIQNLSIVDVLMFNNINEISGMLSQYNLITNDNFLHQ